jgi:hypothetical protein
MRLSESVSAQADSKVAPTKKIMKGGVIFVDFLVDCESLTSCSITRNAVHHQGYRNENPHRTWGKFKRKIAQMPNVLRAGVVPIENFPSAPFMRS